MKKIVLTITVIISINYSFSQNCLDQKRIIKDILFEKSIKAFFKDKLEILVTNSDCKKSDSFKFNKKNVVFDDKNILNSLKILEYEVTKKIVFIELSLFNKNVIFSALYRKNNEELLLQTNWTTFVKSGD